MSADALRRLASRIRLSVARVVLQMVDDTAKLQAVQVQVQAGVIRDRAERFQQYGMTSHPLAGAEGIAVAVGGSTDHLVVICVDDRRYRLSVEAGEVALYDDLGHKVHLTRDGIVIDGGGHQVTITNTPKLLVEGDIEATGTITDMSGAGGRSMDSMRATYDGHTHTEHDVHGQTDPPLQPM